MAIRKTTAVIALVLIGGAYFTYSHFTSHGSSEKPGAGMQAPPVPVAVVEERQVQLWHEFSGRLNAVDSVAIRPRVAGTIDSIHFKEGAYVKKGDLLFVIDPRPYQAALQSAQAKASFAESELKRAQLLVKDKAIPLRDFQQRRDNAAVAAADLTNARLNLDYTQIRSPITGQVGRAEITLGNLVAAGGSAPVLTTVVSNNPIYADFEIDEDTYLQLAQAQGGKHTHQLPVLMGLANETDATHSGHIQSFDNSLNSSSGTIRARAIFDNKDGLLVPGLFARIRLGSANESNVVLIRDSAVGTDQNRKFVYVIGADNKIEYREITPGPLVDELQVVKSGLKPGEKIVLNILPTIFPGMAVDPKVQPMDEKPETGNTKAETEAKKQ